ncbi:MAG: hypothetical protein ACOX2X_01415 [Peptococcia bacterium]
MRRRKRHGLVGLFSKNREGKRREKDGINEKTGIHYALQAVKKWLKEDRKHTKYCV